MHITNGYSYMLSILQFLNSLAKHIKIDLLCLDDQLQVEEYFKVVLGLKISDNLAVIKIPNTKYGIKSNKIFFKRNFLKYISNIDDKDLLIYSRDFKQMMWAIKNINCNARFIFEVHQILSQNYCREGDYRNAKKMKKIENFVFRNCDSLICITSTLSNELKKIFPEATKSHLVLPVGFNKQLLKCSHLEEKKYDIIYSGNFSSWKGLDILLEAIKICKFDFGVSLKVVMIGCNDKTRDTYENIAKSLMIEKNIHFINRLPNIEIRKYISISKIGVLTNKYDADGVLFTSPLKLYEYLGMGLKVVIPRLPSLMSAFPQEIVFYADAENPQSFAREIIKALGDSSLDSKIIRKFAEKYTWDKRAEKFMEFINN